MRRAVAAMAPPLSALLLAKRQLDTATEGACSAPPPPSAALQPTKEEPLALMTAPGTSAVATAPPPHTKLNDCVSAAQPEKVLDESAAVRPVKMAPPACGGAGGDG